MPVHSFRHHTYSHIHPHRASILPFVVGKYPSTFSLSCSQTHTQNTHQPYNQSLRHTGRVSKYSGGVTMELLDHFNVEDEYDKLIVRMNPPRVMIDNEACDEATLVKVHSANKHGILLDVVQTLAEFDLLVKKANISSDGFWFMDVFHVTDHEGKKITNEDITEQIRQSLGRNASLQPCTKPAGRQAALNHTVIELTGTDRPGLLSEMLGILKDSSCNVVEAEIWTHNTRVACVFYVDDEDTGAAIEDYQRLSSIKERLCNVMHPNHDIQSARTDVFMGFTSTERRLHQMMFADRDFEEMDKYNMNSPYEDDMRSVVKINSCEERGYSMISLECKDKPKLLFDIVCTLTDLEYVVFHGTMESEGDKAYQEYYVRHADGRMIKSEAEKQRLIKCLEAAIERRVSEGLRLELNKSSPVGKLSDATRIFRENGLSVARAEIMNNGENDANVFYITDAAGKYVDSKTVETVCQKLGKKDLQVKGNSPTLCSSSHQSNTSTANNSSFSFSDLIKLRSTQFFQSTGLI